MPSNIWKCDTCAATYVEEQQAASCESNHDGPEAFQVVGVNYTPRPPAYRTSLHLPDTLQVRFGGLGAYNTATYRLEHVGPKGV